jgi:hypothetical protein
MSAVKPAALAHGRIAEQVPAFAAIGLFGYFVDAGITFAAAKYGGLSPELARPPGFIIATIVNFALNRSITFRHSRAVRPRLSSLLRRRLGRTRGQLCRLFGLRFSGAPRRNRRDAGDPAAVRRRRQRRRDGSDLYRLSIFRLSAVAIVNCLAQSLLRRAMIAAKRCGRPARCPFRPMTATSIAIRPIFSR